VEVATEARELLESVERLLMEVVPTADQSGEILVKWATLQIKVPFPVAFMREASGS
jgi:hypothetical protein